MSATKGMVGIIQTPMYSVPVVSAAAKRSGTAQVNDSEWFQFEVDSQNLKGLINRHFRLSRYPDNEFIQSVIVDFE